jgi:hypothetical protein
MCKIVYFRKLCPMRKARGFFTWATLGLLAAFGSGCSSTPIASNDKMGDPLMGWAPPPAAPTPPANAAAQAPVPPIPTTSTSATNASLAAQTQPAPLAIGASDSWIRKVDTTAPATTGAGNVPITPVSQPKVYELPRDDGVAANAGQTPSQPIQPAGSWSAASGPPAVATATAPNPDQLKQMLDQRHVVGQKQDVVAGGIHLTCVVNVPPATSNQIYETTAVDYATAVQAIAQQIDQHR